MSELSSLPCSRSPPTLVLKMLVDLMGGHRLCYRELHRRNKCSWKKDLILSIKAVRSVVYTYRKKHISDINGQDAAGVCLNLFGYLGKKAVLGCWGWTPAPPGLSACHWNLPPSLVPLQMALSTKGRGIFVCDHSFSIIFQTNGQDILDE